MAWLCSYTPVEIIASCGLLPYRLFAEHKKSFYGASLLHTTLCPYVRGALDEVLQEKEGGLEGAVLLHSCSAVSHLYYALERYSKLPFTYLLDLPRDNSPQALAFFAGSLQNFHAALSAHCGLRPREDELWEQIYLYAANRQGVKGLYRENAVRNFTDGAGLVRLVRASMTLPAEDFRQLLKDYSQKNHRDNADPAQGVTLAGPSCGGSRAGFFHPGLQIGSGSGIPGMGAVRNGPRIFLTGSMAPYQLLKKVHELGGRIVLDDLCCGKRAVDFTEEPAREEKNPYRYLAHLYLKRIPCACMKDALGQILNLKETLPEYNIDGIIFSYLKFCDPWYYYGQLLKEKLRQVPVLVLETEEMGVGVTGQQVTRIAAFLEMLTQA